MKKFLYLSPLCLCGLGAFLFTLPPSQILANVACSFILIALLVAAVLSLKLMPRLVDDDVQDSIIHAVMSPFEGGKANFDYVRPMVIKAEYRNGKGALCIKSKHVLHINPSHGDGAIHMPQGTIIHGVKGKDLYIAEFDIPEDGLSHYHGTPDNPVTDEERNRWYVESWAKANGVELS